MKIKQLFLIAGLGLMGVEMQAQSSTSISKDSKAFVSWANGAYIQRGWVNIADTSVKYKGSNEATYGCTGDAVGIAGSTASDVVSLGDGGIATLTFDRPIVNGSGADFAVFENGQYKQGTDSIYAELGFVEVSSDGSHFVRFPAVSNTKADKQIGGFSPIKQSDVSNFAGAEIQGYGTPFNLDDIKDSANIDLQNIRFVRIVDAVGNIDPKFASHDSKGNVVNDPWPTPYWSSGFDLDGVGVINAGIPYAVSTFEALTLSKDSYFTPTKTDTAFVNGVSLFSTAKTDYGIDAFTYSNLRNDTTVGYTNSFSAITKGGVSAPDSGGTNYAIAYLDSYGKLPVVSFKDKEAYVVDGFYVTNATYAYLSMLNGDAYAKKFGGATGKDADWLKLRIWGTKADGSKTDTVDFYLADFRSDESSNDYIVKDWRWVDLSSLGEITSVHFGMASSDVGSFGMNTPSYFCIDNFSVITNQAPISSSVVKENNVIAYPNPCTSVLNVQCEVGSVVTLFDVMGQVVSKVVANQTSIELSTENIPTGYYEIQIANKSEIQTLKIIKQ